MTTSGFLPDAAYASALLNAVSCAETLCVLVVAFDGRLVECNEGARRAFGTEALVGSHSVWDLLSKDSGRVVRDFIAQWPDRPAGRLLLNFAPPGAPAVSFSCEVLNVGDSWVVFGECLPERDARIQEELLELTQELSTAARERAKLAAQLASTLADLQQSHWNIRRLQEYLPVCAVCHKVRQNATTGEAEWKALTTFLLENGLTMSHGYCPECEAAANAEIDRMPG
jgi:cytochrome c553